MAADFFTVEVRTRKGLQRFMVLFFIELSTPKGRDCPHRLCCQWIVDDPDGQECADPLAGILEGMRYLIHDRDPLYTAEFLTILQGVGVKSVRLPPRSPNLNAHAERLVRSIKESCLDRMILFGEASLKMAIMNFMAHYHSERNHQGLANRIILSETSHVGNSGSVQRRQRLGDMLNYDYRAAA